MRHPKPRPLARYLHEQYTPEEFREALTSGALLFSTALERLQDELEELHTTQCFTFSKAYGDSGLTSDQRKSWADKYQLASIPVDRTDALGEVYNEVHEQLVKDTAMVS
jgi:hypothetical protein